MSPDDYKRKRIAGGYQPTSGNLGSPPTSGTAVSKARSHWRRSLGGGLLKAALTGNDRWTTIPVAPDAIIAQQHTATVARSREQWLNNDYVRAFVRLVRQNVVGPQGVTMQAKVRTPRGKLDKPLNDALDADWAEWGQKGNCDVTGRLSWREIQCLALVTAARDGEFIVRKVYGPDAGPHGFALQMIDPQRLPVWRNVDSLPGGGFMRHGIEYNRFGRPVAYHFTSTDEGDATFYYVSTTGFVRVPAGEIIHEFLMEMVGMKRGLPWATSSLQRLRNVEGFEEAAVQNARAGATKMGFIEWHDGHGPDTEDDDPVSIDAEPLSFHELPPGAKLSEWQPQFPSAETATFLKSQLRGGAAGMGVPYNEMANDLEGVNFSSIRQLTLDAREHYKELQQWLVDALIAPVRDAHLAWRLLNGALLVKGRPVPADRLAACRAVAWQPRRWQWIDPAADVKAALDAMRGGLISPSQIIREQGRDPDAVFTEIADDMKAMAAAGIPESVVEFFFKGAAAGNVKGDDDPGAAPTDAEGGKQA